MSVVESSAKTNSPCCAEATNSPGAAGTGPIAPRASEGSLGSDFLLYLRHRLRDRRVMIGLAAVVLGAGAWFNWGWLVAVGVAPLILAMAPCAVMCAFGMCAMGGKKSCGKDATPQQAANDGTASASPVARREDA